MVKNFEEKRKIFIRFGVTHERDRQTDRHRMPAIAALCIASHGNKTANINFLKMQFIRKLTASNTSKTAKITKR